MNFVIPEPISLVMVSIVWLEYLLEAKLFTLIAQSGCDYTEHDGTLDFSARCNTGYLTSVS
jgi:hypothetical protein